MAEAPDGLVLVLEQVHGAGAGRVVQARIRVDAGAAAVLFGGSDSKQRSVVRERDAETELVTVLAVRRLVEGVENPLAIVESVQVHSAAILAIVVVRCS